MKLTISALARLPDRVPAVVHSLDGSLYQVTVRTWCGEHLLVEDDGRPFRRHSLNAVREALRDMPVTSMVLRQRSAYDEMIGQPMRTGSNEMEIPVSREN